MSWPLRAECGCKYPDVVVIAINIEIRRAV